MKELNELFPGRTVTGQDLVKYRLWKEQDGRCAYSIQPLELDKVITVSGYAEVDHIVPYSISFDDRRTNKVLVLASENRQKETACRCNTCRENNGTTLLCTPKQT